MIQNDEAMKRIKNEKMFDKMTPPILILRAGLDTIVDNKEVNDYFTRLPQPDKQMITYDEVDHNIWQDGEYLNLIMHDLVSWMNIRSIQI